MTDNLIRLKKNESILKLRIIDENGNDTGNVLTFNLEDIELPIRYQQIIEEDKKARTYLKNQLTIIDKREDHKGKKLYSANEEAKIKAMIEFYKKEAEIYDMFLGKDGVKKILNGRELSWSTLDEIDEIIRESIMPKLNVSAENIKTKITEKYGKQVDDVIE